MPESPVTDQGVIRFPIHRFRNGAVVAGEDELAVEEPLEIQLGYMRKSTRVYKSVSITMRTPGHDAELAELLSPVASPDHA